MIQRFSLLILSFLFLVLSSCYTISHPQPCPGLVDLDAPKESTALNY